MVANIWQVVVTPLGGRGAVAHIAAPTSEDAARQAAEVTGRRLGPSTVPGVWVAGPNGTMADLGEVGSAVISTNFMG